MAFPTVETRLKQTFSSSTTWTVNLPATINDGDILVIFTANVFSTLTTPDGWTLEGNGLENIVELHCISRVADGTEGSTVDLDWSGNESGSCFVYRFSGAEEIEVNVEALGDTTTPNQSSYNPAGWGTEETLWVLGLGMDNVATISAFPSGYSFTDSTTTGSGNRVATCRKENEAASEDPPAWTLNSTSDVVGVLIAVRPKAPISQAVSGASTNAGLLSTELVILQSLAGTSTNAGALATLLTKLQSLAGTSANTGALLRGVQKPQAGTSTSAGTLAAQTVFSVKWSLEHLESRTDYGFPTVWVEIDDTNQPTGTFSTGEFYERRLTEVPRLQEAELSSRFGIAGFQTVTLKVDNADGILNNKDIQDAYVRIFFIDEDGTNYREFNGKIVDWSLSHKCTINVEDIDALAITQDLPRRTLNDIVEAEKAVDGTFENCVVADDLGKPIPVYFGRNIKVPLLYIKADDTNREYDYIIGEGLSSFGALSNTIANATFAASNGTLLQNYTSDSGHSWIKRTTGGPQDFEIQNNALKSHVGAGSQSDTRGYHVEAEPQTDEYDFKVKAKMDAAVASTGFFLFIREDPDPSNLTAYRIFIGGTGHVNVLRDVEGETTVSLTSLPSGTLSLSDDTYATIRIYTNIDSNGDVVLKGFIDHGSGESEFFSVVDTDAIKITHRGRAGLGTRVDDVGSFVTYDDFELRSAGGVFQEVFTVYRNEQALDNIEGDVAAATSNTLTLESADKRPDSWYKYWWLSIITGTGAGQIQDTTAYDSATNKTTISGSWSPTPDTLSDYELTEWQFFNGSQSSPYAGCAFIRFKKRLGTSGRTDPIYADINGFGAETNVIRAIQSLLTNSTWGLGLTVDTSIFDTAAALSEITAMKCEGGIYRISGTIGYINELLAFRDMILSKAENIQVSVDQTKSSSFDFGLGDETGWKNILTESPQIFHVHPRDKVKDLKVKYRKNNKEQDVYQYELERSANSNGVDTTINLPFVYDHETADRWLDYKRKRFIAAIKRLAFDVGQEGPSATRGDRVTVHIPSLGLSDSPWEVTGVDVTPAGANSIELVPYSADPYTYVPITSEGGSLPVDESFDIPPDYDNTIPDPVTNVSVSMNMDTLGVSQFPFALVTWDPPEDNYSGAVVSIKLHSDGESSYRNIGTYENSARVEGLTPGQLYDFKIESLNINGSEKGLAVVDDNSGNGYLAGGDSSAPSIPSGLSGSAKFGTLIWTFTRSSSNDVWYHEYEIYTASSGGTRLKRGKIFVDDDPQFEYTRNTGDLTSTLTGYAQVRAVDYSGNASSYTSRVSASTNDVERDDLEDNATMNIETVQSASEEPGVDQTQGQWYTVLSDTITTDRTGIVKVRYSGQWVPTSSGMSLRLRRGGSTLASYIDIDSVGKDAITLTDARSTGSGSHTYTIETRSGDAGGLGLGLTDNSLSIQGDFK